MPITLETKTVFRCECVLCGWVWDAFAKPRRCAKCKRAGWNGEDQRLKNPFAGVPPAYRIKMGKKVPRMPRTKELVELLTKLRAITDQVIYDNPCNHQSDQCVCSEKKTLALTDKMIDRLNVIARENEPQAETEPEAVAAR